MEKSIKGENEIMHVIFLYCKRKVEEKQSVIVK